jgi:hypothetical protein
MNITSDPNLWAICALTFLLGLLIGIFMTAGGRRKWKTRYHDEVSRRETLERTHKEHLADWTSREKEREAHWATREKEWREQDSLRGAAVKSRRGAAADPVIDRDLDGDGVRDDLDRRPTDDRKA